MKIEKRGFQMSVSLEMMAMYAPDAPQQKGHWEKVTPTAEQIAQRKRAQAALKELESNPFVEWPRMEDDIFIRHLTRREWVEDESWGDYLERLRAWYEGKR